MNTHNILDLIGNTPLVKVQNIFQKEGVLLLLKLEGNNPGGSVKDRAAYNMILSAMDRGEIDKKSKLIEPTSGNTGIALAMIAQLFGLDIEIVMSASATKERVQTMKAYGAKVTLTPAKKGILGARDYAEAKVKNEGYYMFNQFGNDDNWKAHYKTTGPEIWKDTDGEITHFISAMGTTGTIMGTSTFLKEQNPDIQIIGTEPTEGSQIPGIRKWPKEYLPTIFDAKKVDKVISVSESEARTMCKRLAKEEGIFCGMSAGGAAATALKVAQQIDKGVVVTIIPDKGDRYLSSDLFD